MDHPNLVAAYHSFGFDYVYGPDSTQSFVYESTARPAVQSVLEGYNATILAYGQTGTGKTFTMEGPPNNRGVNMRALRLLFDSRGDRAAAGDSFVFRLSMLEIYNETVRDLLTSDTEGENKLDIRQVLLFL